MDIRHCNQCSALGYRPKSYCKPFCKQNGENILIDIFQKKPRWCPKDMRGDKDGKPE